MKIIECVSYGIFFAVRTITNYIKSVRDALDTPDLHKRMDWMVHGGPFRLRIFAAVPKTADKEEKLLPPPFLNEKLPLRHQNNNKEMHFDHASDSQPLSVSVTWPGLHHS